jgi:hypothetical protein
LPERRLQQLEYAALRLIKGSTACASVVHEHSKSAPLPEQGCQETVLHSAGHRTDLLDCQVQGGLTGGKDCALKRNVSERGPSRQKDGTNQIEAECVSECAAAELDRWWTSESWVRSVTATMSSPKTTNARHLLRDDGRYISNFGRDADDQTRPVRSPKISKPTRTHSSTYSRFGDLMCSAVVRPSPTRTARSAALALRPCSRKRSALDRTTALG